MRSKPAWQSKAMWSGGLIALGTLLVAAGQFLNGEVNANTVFQNLQLFINFFVGTGIVGVRMAQD